MVPILCGEMTLITLDQASSWTHRNFDDKRFDQKQGLNQVKEISNVISRENKGASTKRAGSHSHHCRGDEFSVNNVKGTLGGLEDNHRAQVQLC